MTPRRAERGIKEIRGYGDAIGMRVRLSDGTAFLLESVTGDGDERWRKLEGNARDAAQGWKVGAEYQYGGSGWCAAYHLALILKRAEG
jgi:hypothetical protein